jgi:hypothetical protein
MISPARVFYTLKLLRKNLTLIALFRFIAVEAKPETKRNERNGNESANSVKKILILPLAASIKITTSKLRNPINRRKKRKGATSRATNNELSRHAHRSAYAAR